MACAPLIYSTIIAIGVLNSYIIVQFSGVTRIMHVNMERFLCEEVKVGNIHVEQLESELIYSCLYTRWNWFKGSRRQWTLYPVLPWKHEHKIFDDAANVVVSTPGITCYICWLH